MKYEEIDPILAQLDGEALYKLGDKYTYGDESLQNFELASRCYRYAVEKGCERAQNELQMLLEILETIERADKGDVNAQYELGDMFSSDESTLCNYDQGKKYLKLAADQGHTEALARLGTLYLEKNRVKEAVQYLKLAADQGHTEALARLGMLYLEENRVKEAIEYLETAADQGHIEAAYKLGEMYRDGDLVEQDFDSAKFYYESAAEAEDKVDKFCTEKWRDAGEIHRLSGYVWDAINAYEHGAAHGDLESQLQLAELCHGEGFSECTAFYYWLAAKEGDVDAQFKIAEIYADGDGVEVDYEKAEEFYQLAADQGSEEAKLKIAELRERNGDLDGVVEILKELAKDDNEEAQAKLGEIYCDGDIQVEDIAEAVRYIKVAAEQGRSEAQSVIDEIREVLEE